MHQSISVGEVLEGDWFVYDAEILLRIEQLPGIAESLGVPAVNCWGQLRFVPPHASVVWFIDARVTV